MKKNLNGGVAQVVPGGLLFSSSVVPLPQVEQERQTEQCMFHKATYLGPFVPCSALFADFEFINE